MSLLIQALERRMLMSVTAATLTTDVSNVKTDAATVVVDHTTRVTVAKEGYAGVVADLKILDENATRAVKLESVRQTIRLAEESLITHDRIVADMNVFLSYAKLEATLGGAAGKGLLLHPTSVAFQKLVAKEISNLNTNVAPKLTKLQTELTDADSILSDDYAVISDSNPSIASVIGTAVSNLEAASAALSSAAGKVETDTAQLATDLAAIPT